MSATKKITKDMIVDAALEIFRAEGFDAVTSRRVAFKLGCSTQPIYFEYKNMDELKNDIVKKVVGQLNEIFSSVSNEGKEEPDEFVYRSFGLSFLKFVQADPFVFRQIYIVDGKIGRQVDNLRMPIILDILENKYGYKKETALAIHKMASCSLMGMAVFVSSGYKKISEDEMQKNLGILFASICSVYGPPPKLMKIEKFRNHFEKLMTSLKK
ncbi:MULTISPECIES: TetR/AcrR family transcriptional regulator [Treponema]|uniref:Regulatory protein TetR n=1 Tax=Treponema succinifaciens (strain ATCC 33096 / DSM 2489 / 6091) TaxID=869209 RepID=F2NV75_TRES6|nr:MULTISPECIES: TetR/AcrR family transcriptional regulator [Treponema]AEB13310.1 regulatory protein TetR [Treponema succinifaciens DSM 2489]MCI6913531.1 TetR/AcrR family transcriptional regulator [Treponema succinifaciens]MDD6962087.1 TetR/AcrR family transcriptional regulator [Treponema succinifaciens]MDY5116312.1 TetR/AcrR family transcriptional regulator [Treponema succinifaciens]